MKGGRMLFQGREEEERGYHIVMILYAIRLRRLLRPYFNGYRSVRYRSSDMTLKSMKD